MCLPHGKIQPWRKKYTACARFFSKFRCEAVLMVTMQKKSKENLNPINFDCKINLVPEASETRKRLEKKNIVNPSFLGTRNYFQFAY